MKSFRKILNNKDFPITYEPDAPTGTNIEESLTETNFETVDAFGIYSNPGGKPKLDSFVYGWKLKEKYEKDIVVNIRTQDFSVPLFQSFLWGGHVLGIRNLLLITGDYYQGSPSLISVTEGLSGINKYLNNGYLMPDLNEKAERYSERLKEKEPKEKFEGKTDYFTGAVLIPHRQNETEIYQKKVDAGAKFFMTQITYSSREIIDFLENKNPTKPILVGCAPINSIRSLDFLKENLNVKGLSNNIIKRLKKAENMGKKSVEICIEMYNDLKDYADDHGYSLGAHVMSIGSPERVQEITRRL